MNRTFALAAMAALSCAAATAQGADQPVNRPVNREVITVADLDLHSPADIRTLDRRILTAVRAACGEASDADVAGSNAMRRCQRQLLTELAVQRARLIAGDPLINVAAR